jgi:hypothetical protein
MPPNPKIPFRVPEAVLLAVAVGIGGCASVGTVLDDVAADVSAGKTGYETMRGESYRTLDERAEGAPVPVTLPDGFGSGGVTVERRYFSASGKDCIVISDMTGGGRRTLCRDQHGNVNELDASAYGVDR